MSTMADPPTRYRGRFAPSPTGQLHVGSACTALCAWLAARSAGGSLVVRVEDIDTPRVVKGAADLILDDLHWLGLDWDEGPDIGGPWRPYVQSVRMSHYDAALATLRAAGVTYLCDCSRSDVARVASAPHAGDRERVYPGTCRQGNASRAFRRPPAVRLATPDRQVRFVDRVHGSVVSHVATETGDFVLRRGDGTYSYQLAVVVDDLAMGITEVVRGEDLLCSTARQILLAELLGGRMPSYAHVPLVVAADGQRLAKRARGVSIRDLRAASVDPHALVAKLARALGLATVSEPHLAPADLIGRFRWERVRPGPVRWT